MSEFVPVLAASELLPGQCRQLVVAGQRIALCNVLGSFHAVGGVCGHRGGPLGEGVLDGSLLVCPWHGWAYDVTTGAHESSEAQRIPSYEVRAESGQVLVKAGIGGT